MAPDTIGISEVEVVAPAKAPVELLPLTVTTLTERELEQSAETSILPVMGDRVPGVYVTERGIAGYGVSDGAAGAVSIRGVGGNNKVLFMIDGQPQWASIFGHALPDTYTSGDVAKVEIVRGPSSLLYGSGAMGGSVNIITRHAGQRGFAGSASLMGGSYGTLKSGLNLGYGGERFNAFVNATYERTDGARRNSQYWLASQFVSLQYRITNHWRVGGNITLTETTPHNPGTTENPLNEMWTRIFRGTAALFVNDTYGRSSGQIQLYANWGDHTVNDGYSATGTTTNNGVPRDYLFHSHDYNMGFTVYQNIRLFEGNVTSAGVDFQHWGGNTYNRPVDGSPDVAGVDTYVNETAFYVMSQQDFFSDRLSVNAGLRYQHSGQFGSMLVPQAGLIARLVKGNTFKFSWGKGFRSPNLRELYMYPPHNPELKPEYLWNYEIEIRQTMLGGRLEGGLSLYYIDGKDMIQTVRETNPETGAPMRNKNIGAFRNKGFEVDATYFVTREVSLSANYSYLQATENVLYAPKHKIYGSATWSRGDWRVMVESVTILRLRNGGAEKENYSLLNATVAYRPSFIKGQRLTLRVKGDNLTATRYEPMAGYPMPGVTVLAGVTINF